MNFYKFFSTFVGLFCPPGSGPGLRIRIHWPDWIRIQSGSGSATLLFCVSSNSFPFGNCWVQLLCLHNCCVLYCYFASVQTIFRVVGNSWAQLLCVFYCFFASTDSFRLVTVGHNCCVYSTVQYRQLFLLVTVGHNCCVFYCFLRQYRQFFRLVPNSWAQLLCVFYCFLASVQTIFPFGT